MAVASLRTSASAADSSVGIATACFAPMAETRRASERWLTWLGLGLGLGLG